MENPSKSSPQEQILLVDDTPANLHILTKILADKGYGVQAIDNGWQAIQSAVDNPPNLILLDIHMPDIDGYQVCEKLKADERTCNIPVVFISAMGDTEDKIRGFKVGGIDYITKPFQLDEVLARIDTHLTIHKLQRELLQANHKLANDVDRLKKMEAAEHEQRVLAETFRDIATSISSNLDLEKVLDMIIFGISQLIENDVINISLINPNGTCRIVRQMGYEKYMDEKEILGIKMPVAETPNLARMVQTGQPCLIYDFTGHPGWKPPQGKEWLRSYLGAPICVKNKAVGFISLESSIPGFYKPEQTEHLLSFTSQASAAIENARLYAEAQRRVKELSILNEISLLISSTTNLSQVTELVYQQVSRLIDAYYFMIGVYNYEKGEWGSLYIRRDGKRLENFVLKTDQGFGGYVIRKRQSLFLPDKKTITTFINKNTISDYGHIPASLMMVPLIFSNKVIGVIGVEHDLVENAFEYDDFALFNNIGVQVAIWIENARLFSEMEKLAVTDNLTGINNRRQLFLLAQAALDRAIRYKHDLSIIMIDIDHFKEINDEYGHPVGDEILSSFTRLCTQNLRIVDIIGRYGGEEFLIIMPETDYQNAFDAAQRLLKQIEKMKIKIEDQTVHITASMGIVSLGKDERETRGMTLDFLIHKADDALYRAKDAGRNQVCG